MKQLLCWVSVGAVMMAPAAFAQGRGPGAPVTLAASLQQAYDQIKKNVTEAAERMPEGDYDMKPNPDIRTFGGQLGHIANAHYFMCAAAKGVPNPNMGKDLEKLTTKAEFVKALADSYAFCDGAFSSLTDQNATQMVNMGRGKQARAGLLAGLIAHDNEEYGIITVYMRLKSMVPPSTADRPAMRGGGGRGRD
jgi:uncharacterized damage-inducible protein DinB